MAHAFDIDRSDQYLQTAGGLLVPGAMFENNGPVGIDLFCGCGGMSLGCMQGGWRIMAGVDNDPYAALTYMTNLGTYPCEFHFIEDADRDRMEEALLKQYGFKGRKKNRECSCGVEHYMVSGSGWISSEPRILGVPHFFLGDIRKLSGQQILDAIGLEVGQVDGVFGGPPCQGFSRANRNRNCIDPRNSFVFEFARLVLEIQPKTMMMENVPAILDMTTPEGLPVIDMLTTILEEGGFGTAESLKKSLASSAGVGAALKGKGKKVQKRPKAKRQAAEDEEQLDMFGGGDGE